MYTTKIKLHVKEGALIQGGAFRMDKGPTKTELHSFRLAVTLVEECRKDGKVVSMGCIVNDLALKPEKRPKATGVFEWPKEYLQILSEAGISTPEIVLFYESSLRNGAKRDLDGGKIEDGAFKINERTGIEVPRCRSIMGKFYSTLAKKGYTQQVGFYTYEPKPEANEEAGEIADNACPFGPIEGALKRGSGYELRLAVLNYFVYPDGRLQTAGLFEPDK